MEHYESHPLAADSDDEKRLKKAEKEAERAANKCRWGSGSVGTKKKSLSGGAGPSSRMREPPAVVPPPLLPQGQQGHQEFRCWDRVFLVNNTAT